MTAGSADHGVGVLVRDLVAGDRPEWEVLFAGYNAFYEAELAPAIVEATFARLSDPADTAMLGLVAEDAVGRLVGLAHVIVHPSTWALGGYAYLEDLYVAPAARGRGVGRRLIEAVYARADALGLERTYWVTRSDNGAARILYDTVADLAPFVQYRRREG